MSVTVIQGSEESLEQSRKQASLNHQPDAAAASSRNQAQYVPAAARRTYKSPIDQITFLLTGEETGGAFFMADVMVPPGCGNPPHIHECETETFYLQQGTLTVQIGDRTLNASPGDNYWSLPGTSHVSFEEPFPVSTTVATSEFMTVLGARFSEIRSQ